MKSNFYASGFLYHSNSQKILLQQNSTEEKITWTLLGGPSKNLEAGGKTFRQIAQKLLNLKLKPSAVHQIYDYYHAAMRKKHVVSYAEVKKLDVFPAKEKISFAWFTLKEISKLCLSSQTKQDIIVGQRVINSSVRKASGEQTIG